jgi:CHAD domain-containing protein
MPKRTFGLFMRTVIFKRLQRILDDGTVAFASGHEQDLHAIRIAVKRLRYTIEFAASLAPDGAREALDLLSRLQERLGTLADFDTFERAYAALLDGLAANDPRRVGIEALRAESRGDRDRALAGARAFWLAEPPYPERLAASISAAFVSSSPKPEP